MQAKKRNLKGEELGDVAVTKVVAEAETNPQLVKDIILIRIYLHHIVWRMLIQRGFRMTRISLCHFG